jgi:adenosylcobyric acid synthase
MAFKPLMLAGTASNVGKSILTTAFCRIFRQDGFAPAPFKAQNMSLNSYATPDGYEIGRAQATQAEAAGIPCHTDMNPVLLKPNGNLSSQVILHGKPIGNQSAYDYFKKEGKDALFEEVKKSFTRLSSQYNPIVMEGAGSVAELNLKDKDIVNMRMAQFANAAVILVADIDRGGVFASVYGSVKLLPEHERKLIKGIIVNKFRGDARLFESGIKILEEITEVPVLGVVPHFRDIDIDEEDSVGLETRHEHAATNKTNVCVIRHPQLSNFTDFKIMEKLEGVQVYYTNDPSQVEQADIIILPGSKNTITDMQVLYDSGLAATIHQAYRAGKKVIGICGGYQMLGEEIHDPFRVESDKGSIKGLGLLPVKTILAQNKQTYQKKFRYRSNDTEVCNGYEIHMGTTEPIGDNQPVNYTKDGNTDGYFLHERCWGTYMHGIFDNPIILKDLFKEHNVTIPDTLHDTYKDAQYDALADWVRQSVDIDKVYNIMQK